MGATPRSGTSVSRNYRRIVIGVILAAGLLALWSTQAAGRNDFVKGAVPSEKGFDGAVSVVDTEVYGNVGCVTVEIPYLDVHGKRKVGQGRLIVRKETLESGQPIPVFCHVHYEKDVGGAGKWCRKGWAVATAHYDKKHPIDVSVGDGYNLASALIQWVRRLPFADRTHLHIDGGSQGGYMALAMSARTFPVSATTADCPVLNWAYNFNYFEVNRPVAKWPQEDINNSPLPVVCMVTMLCDWAYDVFGKDPAAESWYRMSPISYLDLITNPVLVLCATGDMLVPMEQMTRKHLRPYDPERFPEGYQRDFDTITVCEPARKTFEELVPEEDVAINMVPLQEGSFELTLDYFTGKKKKPITGPGNMDRPWSPGHQWSMCYLDEGPPTPYASHTSYEWATSPDSFVEAHQGQQPGVELLTAPKLAYLLKRYEGKLDNLPALADGTPANRLNYADLEKLDVVTGLLDYAALGAEYADRLETLYGQGGAKPLGESATVASLTAERGRLLDLLGLAAQNGGE